MEQAGRRRFRRAKEQPTPRADAWQGLWIVHYRKARAWSVRDLARKAEIPPTNISRYERATSQLPFDEACKIAASLGIHVALIWDHRRPPGHRGPDPFDSYQISEQ